jgi:hypothetical protein
VQESPGHGRGSVLEHWVGPGGDRGVLVLEFDQHSQPKEIQSLNREQFFLLTRKVNPLLRPLLLGQVDEAVPGMSQVVGGSLLYLPAKLRRWAR